MLAYTCKPLTAPGLRRVDRFDIFVYDLESGATQNICKPTQLQYR